MLSHLIEKVIEQIPSGPYKPLITAMVSILMDAGFDDWEEVMDIASDLLIAEALDEVRDVVSENILDEVFDQLDIDTSIGNALKEPIKEVAASLISNGFDGFENKLEQFAQTTGKYVLEEGREKIVDAVKDILDRIAELFPAGDLRDFLIGVAGDLMLAAIPEREERLGPVIGDGEIEHEATGWKLNYQIDNDLIIESFVRHGLYHVVLKKYYVEKARNGMYALLGHAKNFIPEEEYPYQWEFALETDFTEYRRQVEPLQDVAWNALGTQEDIEDWAEILEVLVVILDGLSDALDAFSTFYPPFRDEAQAVHGLIAILDGLQVIPRAIEFGLMLDALDTFGEEAKSLYSPVFP